MLGVVAAVDVDFGDFVGSAQSPERRQQLLDLPQTGVDIAVTLSRLRRCLVAGPGRRMLAQFEAEPNDEFAKLRKFTNQPLVTGDDERVASLHLLSFNLRFVILSTTFF